MRQGTEDPGEGAPAFLTGGQRPVGQNNPTEPSSAAGDGAPGRDRTRAAIRRHSELLAVAGERLPPNREGNDAKDDEGRGGPRVRPAPGD
jgi:hypothetical protein